MINTYDFKEGVATMSLILSGPKGEYVKREDVIKLIKDQIEYQTEAGFISNISEFEYLLSKI